MSFNPRTPGFPDAGWQSARIQHDRGNQRQRDRAGACRLAYRATVVSGRFQRCSVRLAIRIDIPGLGHLELEGFNSPPVVESADTGPFFHNHMVSDLESAVAFYGTPAFQTSIFATPPVLPVSISADPDDPEVQAIAAFLRVLNALENIRSAINVAERGRTMTSGGRHARPGRPLPGRDHRRTGGLVPGCSQRKRSSRRFLWRVAGCWLRGLRLHQRRTSGIRRQ